MGSSLNQISAKPFKRLNFIPIGTREATLVSKTWRQIENKRAPDKSTWHKANSPSTVPRPRLTICSWFRDMAFPPTLWPSRLIDQNFGMCITPEDFILPFYSPYSTNYYRPWNWCMQNVVKDFGSTVNNQSDSFKVTLDVQHFRPNEVSVKVVNSQILIEGKHEERKDEHGYIARQFTRRYALPNNCKPEDVTSNLSSDGILTVTAKKESIEELKKNEKVVPIKLCKSCPLTTQDTNKSGNCINLKDTSEQMKVDNDKRNTQIMLKEDHCCLLSKQELLREAASDSLEVKTGKKKEKDESEKVKPVQQATKNTANILDETLSKSSAVTSTELSESTIDKTRSVLSTSSEMTEQMCAKPSATASGIATSSKEMQQTCMATTQMSELATSSKASASMESSSYKSSITSTLKDIDDDLSDFVSDILCSELEAAEDFKEFKKQE